jgi:predicted permease
MISAARRWLAGFRADVAHTGRQILRAPIFTAVCVAILAVGIGVNSAFFSFIDTLLFQPVPGIERTDRLVRLSGGRSQMLAFDAYAALRDDPGVFSGVAASLSSYGITVDVDGDHSADRVQFVSAHYFTTLKPMMEIGHGLADAPDDKRLDNSVVIGYKFWLKSFGGQADALGRTINLNGVQMRIVGVTKRGFFQEAAVLAPMSMMANVYGVSASQAALSERFSSVSFLAARLNDGVSVEAARAFVQAAMSRLPSKRREIDVPAEVQPLRMVEPGDIERLTGPFGLIGNVTLFILLIAATNVSVLLLSRAVARRREVGVRLAMGAARARVVRQLITEGVILAVLSSIFALMLLQWFGVGLIRLFWPTAELTLHPSAHVIVAAMSFALITGLLFAVVPALHATKVSVMDALRDGTPGLDRSGSRLQNAFVIAEVALSMALVCSAGIFLDAALRAARRDAGYLSSPRTIVAQMEFYNQHFPASRTSQAFAQMVTAAEAIPGVERAAYASTSLEWGSGYANLMGAGYAARGAAPVGDSSVSVSVATNFLSPGVFATLGIDLLQGREIGPNDIKGNEEVVVIDELIARHKWPGRSAIGRQLALQRWKNTTRDTAMMLLTVVGVAPHMSPRGGGVPVVYLSAAQHPDSARGVIFVRSTAASAAPLVPRVTTAIHRVDRELPLQRVATLAQIHRESYRNVYNAAMVASISGLIALLLACVGLYATISFGLSQRTREIGVRRALGADDRDVVYAFFEGGMKLALIGFAIGVPVALAAMRIGVAEKFGVATLTTSSIASVMAVLLAVCALASWLPARRAARIDALTALKQE